jgi:hypothetical protein
MNPETPNQKMRTTDVSHYWLINVRCREFQELEPESEGATARWVGDIGRWRRLSIFDDDVDIHAVIRADQTTQRQSTSRGTRRLERRYGEGEKDSIVSTTAHEPSNKATME